MIKWQWKKLTYATVGVLAIILCIILCAIGMWFDHGMQITTGRCIVSDNGSCLLVVEEGYSEGYPVSLGYQGYQEDPFADWSTGDLVTVVHGMIAETYPGQTNAYVCWHREEGSPTDIPEHILSEMVSLGWLKE